MKKRVSIFLLVLLSSIVISSCLNSVATEVITWIESDNINEVEGSYHFLENDGIKIYLPSVFKKYSTVDYQNLLDSIVPEEAYKYEIARLNNMRKMDGNLYLFYDELSRSTYTINTVKYMPLQKRDAQFLLGMIRQNHEQTSHLSNLDFNKITAKYSSNKDVQIFKAVFRIDNPKIKTSVFSNSYIISSKQKTVLINLSTPYQINFDEYLQKMIL
ncbi:hypothetical protein [Hanstruepera flava]|uniref:hypothetical protein n=1 Tax=Hanstruepera flava TaxID=2930218 RepID=UPI002027EA6D|nr:hypothetical protein [Hanstruepera flava]